MTYKALLLFCALLTATWAENTLEEWQASSGHSVSAKLLELNKLQVKIEKEGGKALSLPLTTFIPEDQERILEHFKVKWEDLLSAGSTATPLTDSPFPLGEVHGPVEVEDDSPYYVYVPESLKKGRLAPLLFYTNAAGGDTKHHLETLAETAELFSCILAYSIKSSNANGWENNIKDVALCMADLFNKLPIDKGRIHYTGNSGGGNTACLNSSVNKAWGIMPNVAMLPEGLGVDTEVVYALGGATDHNRFLTAHAADMYDDNGFHRMSNNGHGDAPVEHRCDGMLWMTSKYLSKHKEEHPEEMKDFERSTLLWLHALKDSSPQRAYANALLLKEVYGLEGDNAYALDLLIQDLAKEKDNILYQEALQELNAFSRKHLAPIGKKGWTAKGHAGIEGVPDAEALKEKYGHLEELGDVIDGLMKSAPRQK